MALSSDSISDSLGEQLRLQSVGVNCGQSFIALNEAFAALATSLGAEADSKLRTALAAQQAKNKGLGTYLTDAAREPFEDIAEFLGEDVFSDIKDPFSATGGFALEIADFPELFGAITATSTGILGSVGASSQLLDPENARQLTKNVLDYGKNGGCSGGIGESTQIWGATFNSYATGIQSKIDKLNKDITKFSNSLKSFGQKLGSAFDPNKPTTPQQDDGTLADGLLGVGLQAFEFTIRQEAFVLKEMLRVAKKLREALNNLKDSDYKIDHAQLTDMAKQLLMIAEANLTTVDSSLSRGGALPRANYDYAKKNVDVARQLLKLDTGDAWKDIYRVVPSKRQLYVVYYMARLQLLLKTFEKIAERNQVRNTNFNSYKTDFEFKTSGIDYLFGPIVNLIRCRLKKIIADMNAVMAKDKLIPYLLKEKQWYAELSIVRGMFKSVKDLERVKEQLSRDITIDGFKIADGSKLFKVDVDMGRVTSGYIGSTSAAEVIADGKKFVEVANQKLHKNLPGPSVVTTLPPAPAAQINQGDTTINFPPQPERTVTLSYIDTFYLQFEFKLTKYMAERENFSGSLLADTFGSLLPEGLQSVVADLSSKAGPLKDALDKLNSAGNAISGAQQFLTLLDENGFDKVSNSLRSGDMKEFFEANAVTANLASQIGDITGIALDCAQKQQDYRKAGELQRLANQSGRDQRSRELAYNILYQSDQEYIQVLLSDYYPELDI